MRPSIMILFILGLATTAPAIPLSTEKMDQMLGAFSTTSFVPGQLVVRFTDTSTVEDAKAILAKHDLFIVSGKQCVTESYGGPGQEPVVVQTCPYIEEWNESLHTAIVEVSVAEEKTYAQLLIQEPSIVWIEPHYTAQAQAGNNGSRVSTHQQDAMAVVEPSGNPLPVVGGVAIVLGILLIWFRMNQK